MFYVLVIAIFVSVVEAASLFNLKFSDKMSTDFLTGFESGVFLRNNT